MNLRRNASREYNITKDQNGALNVDSHVMDRCKNLYTKLLSIYAADKFREPAIHRPTAESLVPDPNFVKPENPIKKLNETRISLIVFYSHSQAGGYCIQRRIKLLSLF
jgi:hypothetical protein